jgi:hypothetical protein
MGNTRKDQKRRSPPKRPLFGEREGANLTKKVVISPIHRRRVSGPAEQKIDCTVEGSEV